LLKDTKIEEYELLLNEYKINSVKLLNSDDRLQFINRMVMNYDPNGSNLLDLINFAKDKDITKEEALTHFNIPRDNFEDWYKSVLPKNEEYFEF